MRATYTVRIPISNKDLSSSAQSGHILDNIKTGSLISIVKLCDDNCAATFTKKYVHIVKNGHLLIKVTQNKSNGFVHIPLSQQNQFPLSNTATTTPNLACSIISSTPKKSELAASLHRTIFSPMPSTLLISVKLGHFTTWPGLTTFIITNIPQNSLPQAKATSAVNKKNTVHKTHKIRHSTSNIARHLSHARAYKPLYSTILHHHF